MSNFLSLVTIDRLMIGTVLRNVYIIPLSALVLFGSLFQGGGVLLDRLDEIVDLVFIVVKGPAEIVLRFAFPHAAYAVLVGDHGVELAADLIVPLPEFGSLAAEFLRGYHKLCHVFILLVVM